MLYILGSDNGDALQYAKKRGLEAGSYKFVTTPEKLQQVNGRQHSLAITGNAWEREDFALITQALRERGFDV